MRYLDAMSDGTCGNKAPARHADEAE